ncbi:MAG: deoxyribose-phosphate aldolase [Patescibacteria group bacterium]
MDKKTFAKYLDLANHHSSATPDEIKELCKNVEKYGFATAFVNPCYVSLARETLGERARVGTVVSFPLGQDTRKAKVFSSLESIRLGADELDISANIGRFKSGAEKFVLDEMCEIVEESKSLNSNVIIKFIIEAELLTETEVKRISELVLKSGADFVKTNSGMGKRGVMVQDIILVKSVVGDRIKIKGAGGVKTRAQATELIEKGADRIGTSKAIEILMDEND